MNNMDTDLDMLIKEFLYELLGFTAEELCELKSELKHELQSMKMRAGSIDFCMMLFDLVIDQKKEKS